MTLTVTSMVSVETKMVMGVYLFITYKLRKLNNKMWDKNLFPNAYSVT